MKDIIAGFTMLAVATLGWIFVVTDAQANMNNNVMKACLEVHGYTPKKFDKFNFAKAADCHSKWRVAENTKQLVKLREFLAENPWYTGKNWQWKTKAEYTCTKRIDLGGIEVCHKPYYLN